jgi:hypothetical protein
MNTLESVVLPEGRAGTRARVGLLSLSLMGASGLLSLSLMGASGNSLKKIFSLINTNFIILDVVKEGGKGSFLIRAGPKERPVSFLEASNSEIDMERIFWGVIDLVIKIRFWDTVVAWIKTRSRCRILVAQALVNVRLVYFQVSSRLKVERSCLISEAES